MKKQNILEPAAAQGIIARVANLRVDSQRQWGTMEVTEMLLHCNLANNGLLEADLPYRRPTVKQWLLRKIGLRVISRIPRGRKGPARLETKGKIDVSAFERERQRFIETVSKFPQHGKPLKGVHPAMGSMRQREWGTLTWMHMDHHLRQFGV